MKVITKGNLRTVILKTSGARLYDGGAEAKPTTVEKTYSQADIDNAYKAGVKKTIEKQTSEAEKKELEQLRQEKQVLEATKELDTLTTTISDLKLQELRGTKRFAKEFKERLTGKTGDALKQEITSIKNEKGNELYFSESSNPSASLTLGQAQTTTKTKTEYWPGTSVRKR